MDAFYRVVLEAPGDENNTDAEDYTSQNPDEEGGDEADVDAGATDYTAQDAEIAPDEEDGDGTDTEENPEEGEGTDDGSGDATDYTSETGEEGAEGDAPAEEQPAETEEPSELVNNKDLMNDMVELYYKIQGVKTTLSATNRENVLINKIISQVTFNLVNLLKVVSDYIIHDFGSNKYAVNLYKYNYFFEAFKINVQMLKKISVFAPN